VYGRVSRISLAGVLRNFDFPDPAITSPGRDVTTTSLQQLFSMNSTFMEQQAAALASRVSEQPDNAARVRALYQRVLARDPNPAELDIALGYLKTAPLARFAQVLLASNEEIFWP
jgi:hypothetical protein